MIEINDLDFQYQDAGFCLKIPHLRIDRGSKTAVVGSSGSGKTTLLFLLAGIYAADAGHIRIAGSDLREMNDAARRRFRVAKIGFVFQDFELVEYLNVRENILLPFLINRIHKLDSSVRRDAEQLASALGLGGKLDRPIRKLSRGEQQRVALCRAVLPKPGVLLADEPTEGLDRENQQCSMALLKERVDQTGASLICVTHNRSLADSLDQTIDMDEISRGVRLNEH